MMYTDNQKDILHVEVTNVPEFNRLLQQARKETEQLSETLRKLSSYTLDFKFSAEGNQPGDIESASSSTRSMPM